MDAFGDSLTFFGKEARQTRSAVRPMLSMSIQGSSILIVHGEREFLSELVDVGRPDSHP